MRHRVSRYLGAAFVATAATVAPWAATALISALTPSVAQPSTAVAQCPPGQTGVIYGCAPFCVEGKFLDTQTGLCTPVAPPPPPAPRY
ncbi:hypothetical protein ACNUDN_01770 [Mycobacterium sp. smrl_JER01]|uniref:hypothetical protein n=1 Tax=Mycobacterium sp. smrl_JER01 TaxID=3402633 RepID=UPI003AD7BD77